MKFILAVDITDDKYGIGKDGKLAWDNIPEDLKFFRETTTGKNVVFGDTTFKQLPPLPNRFTMVLTRKPEAHQANRNQTNENANVEFYNLSQLEKAIELMETKTEDGVDSVFVCGGKQVYELLVQHNEKVKPLITGGYVTCIQYKYSNQNQYDVELKDFMHYLNNNSPWQVDESARKVIVDNDEMIVWIDTYQKK